MPERRKPEDEFFDLGSIQPIETVDIRGDGSIIKYVLTEGVGHPADLEDIVYYRHETRFSNG